MPYKRKQILSNCLLAIIAFYLFTLYFALTYHKSALVTLSSAGKYSDFLMVLSGNNLVAYLLMPFEYIIKCLTFILAHVAAFTDIIFAQASIMKAFVKAGILIFMPYFLLFIYILMTSDKIQPQRIFICTISCSVIINFTFFYSLVNVSDNKFAAKIPLEQLSSYSILNMAAFIFIYSFLAGIFDRKEVEKN